MTFYIRHKATGEDTLIKTIDVSKNEVLTDEGVVLSLVDVIEDFEFRYDIW